MIVYDKDGLVNVEATRWQNDIPDHIPNAQVCTY